MSSRQHQCSRTLQTIDGLMDDQSLLHAVLLEILQLTADSAQFLPDVDVSEPGWFRSGLIERGFGPVPAVSSVCALGVISMLSGAETPPLRQEFPLLLNASRIHAVLL